MYIETKENHMGYNLTIGEAVLESYVEDGLEASCRITAEGVSHPDAPAFGEPTDHTNERWPSYTAWYEFCDKAGLYEAIYDSGRKSLRGGHPGAFPINKEFKAAVDKSYNRIKMQAKTLDPNDDIFTTEVGSVWARIQWLKYWTDWALENCDNPVMANS